MQMSVVIPVLNEADYLADCIHSAWGLSSASLTVAQVLIADGGSQDGSQELALQAGAEVIASPRGRGTQLMAATARCHGEVILMLHADCRLPPEAGQQIARSLSDNMTACGAFRQRIDAAGWAYRLLEWGNAQRAQWLGLPYGDQAIFVRTETLKACGGIADVPIMEDVILMQRLRWRSWPVLLDGPVTISARRWQKNRVLWQTLRNWALLMAFTLGVPAKHLVRWYAPHRTKG